MNGPFVSLNCYDKNYHTLHYQIVLLSYRDWFLVYVWMVQQVINEHNRKGCGISHNSHLHLRWIWEAFIQLWNGKTKEWVGGCGRICTLVNPHVLSIDPSKYIIWLFLHWRHVLFFWRHAILTSANAVRSRFVNLRGLQGWLSIKSLFDMKDFHDCCFHKWIQETIPHKSNSLLIPDWTSSYMVRICRYWKCSVFARVCKCVVIL